MIENAGRQTPLREISASGFCYGQASITPSSFSVSNNIPSSPRSGSEQVFAPTSSTARDNDQILIDTGLRSTRTIDTPVVSVTAAISVEGLMNFETTSVVQVMAYGLAVASGAATSRCRFLVQVRGENGALDHIMLLDIATPVAGRCNDQEDVSG
ncbi:MAG: hypothetical protein LQ348_003173 [Seirophora lacunosa]|nr:MAG: hypothetical protein LQ348_003173 [Seirophora lacunosa]